MKVLDLALQFGAMPIRCRRPRSIPKALGCRRRRTESRAISGLRSVSPAAGAVDQEAIPGEAEAAADGAEPLQSTFVRVTEKKTPTALMLAPW